MYSSKSLMCASINAPGLPLTMQLEEQRQEREREREGRNWMCYFFNLHAFPMLICTRNTSNTTVSNYVCNNTQQLNLNNIFDAYIL